MDLTRNHEFAARVHESDRKNALSCFDALSLLLWCSWAIHVLKRLTIYGTLHHRSHYPYRSHYTLCFWYKSSYIYMRCVANRYRVCLTKNQWSVRPTRPYSPTSCYFKSRTIAKSHYRDGMTIFVLSFQYIVSVRILFVSKVPNIRNIRKIKQRYFVCFSTLFDVDVSAWIQIKRDTLHCVFCVRNFRLKN